MIQVGGNRTRISVSGALTQKLRPTRLDVIIPAFVPSLMRRGEQETRGRGDFFLRVIGFPVLRVKKNDGDKYW